MNSMQISVNQAMVVRVRRQQHMYPELEWDLDETASLVCHELDSICESSAG